MPSKMFNVARANTLKNPTYYHVPGGVQAPSPDTPNLFVRPENSPTREGIYQWIFYKTGKEYGVKVQVDDTGHYLLFEASENGREQMETYYQRYNGTPMLRKEGNRSWVVQFQRRLGVKKVRTEEEKAKRAEKKAKKAAEKESKKRKLEEEAEELASDKKAKRAEKKAGKAANKESKKRKLEEDAEQLASSKKAKLDETTSASIPPAATSDVESGEIPEGHDDQDEKGDLNIEPVEPVEPIATVENMQLPTPHPTSAVISDPPSADWSANFSIGDYDITASDDDEQLAGEFDHDEAVPEKSIVDLDKEKDYTPQDWNNAQVKTAQDDAFYQKQLEARNPIALVVREYIDVFAKSGNKDLSTRKLRLEPLQSINLLDTKWLSDDNVNLYLAFLTDENRQFDMIPSSMVALQVGAKDKAEIDYSTHFAPSITNILVPLNPSGNHWALGVADIDKQTFAVYNSLAGYSGTPQYAEAAVEILHLSGASSADHRLAGIKFTIVYEQVAQQVGGDDCGVWVLANARSIALNKPMPDSIKGFRLHIAKQCLRALKGEALHFNLDTPADVSPPVVPPVVPSNKDDSAGIAIEEPVKSSDFDDDAWIPGQRFSLFKDEDFSENEKIQIGLWDKSVSSYLFGNHIDPEHEIDGECHICGTTTDNKAEHMASCHEASCGLCPWPGCYMKMSSSKACEEHIVMDHECNVWVCHQKGCYRRFRTKEEAMDHRKRDHAGEGRKPEKFDNRNRKDRRDIFLLLKGKRTGLNLGEMEARRVLYRAWADSRAKERMEEQGLLNQTSDAELCRTIRNTLKFYSKNKATAKPTWRIIVGKKNRFLWWATIFFNLPQGPKLDKFIEDTILGWCQVSHVCHTPPCLTFADLEYVLGYVNGDRTSCKNGVREHRGGCGAVDSLHSHMKPCRLERRRGNCFDDPEQAWDSAAAGSDEEATNASDPSPPYEPSSKEKTDEKADHKCPICDRVFRFKSWLTNHMVTHSDERHFECSHCDKTFKLKGQLTEHMVTHSDERHFECSHCDKTFKLKQSLTRHLLNIHSGEINSQ